MSGGVMMILLFNAKVAFSCGNNALKVSLWRKGATMLNCVLSLLIIHFFHSTSHMSIIVLRLIWLLTVTQGHKNAFIHKNAGLYCSNNNNNNTACCLKCTLPKNLLKGTRRVLVLRTNSGYL